LIPGCLDGMTRAEAWRNEYAIRRLAAIDREHDQGAEREASSGYAKSEIRNNKSEIRNNKSET
jgi:hypothetical protein